MFKVEDEIHFVLACPLFNGERQSLLDEIYRTFPTSAALSERNMYFWLMTQEDYHTLIITVWKGPSHGRGLNGKTFTERIFQS